MLVTGHKWGCVCVLYQGIELRVFLFAPHKQTQDAIVKAVGEFQNKLDTYVKDGAIDWYPPASSKELDRIYPYAAAKEEVQLPFEAEQWAGVILQAKADIREAEESIGKAEIQIKKMLGDAERGRAGNVVISWPMRNYKDSPERLVPAKKAYSVRQSSLTVKELP
jgi:predicted phage-related endonuclease